MIFQTIDYLPLFETPIQVIQIEDAVSLNEVLTEKFIVESQNDPGIQRSNAGGWHSKANLSVRTDSAVVALMEMISDCVQVSLNQMTQQKEISIESNYKLALQAWAMVMKNGDYTTPHGHPESHISGVYYLDEGDADRTQHPDSGLLAFLDPRGNVPAIPGLELFPSTFTIKPAKGVIVLFPGFLTHYVHKYVGERPRVSVAFNVRIELQP